MAAHKLSEHGLRIRLVDKGHSVGGRLATRRFGGGLADHGAQFFTVRSPVFQAYVDKWLANELVYIWSNGFNDGIRMSDQFDGHPRYATYGGMNALAKYLAQQLEQKAKFHTHVEITSVTQLRDGWEVSDENGKVYTAKTMVMTPPVPQSLSLLGELQNKLADSDRTALERIAYVPCMAGLFRVDGAVNLPEPGALQRPDATISWIADNQRKGISPAATIITVHSGASVSQSLWEKPDAEALDFLRSELAAFLGKGTNIVEAALKRWRYSQPTVLHPERFLLAEGLPPLIFAGDAFGEARMEGSFLSGLAAGEMLTQLLV